MIPLEPFKVTCTRCGYSKIIKPKSDCLDPQDLMSTCPKCKGILKRKPIENFFDSVKSYFK